jgi:CHAT domain-containing protein
VLATLWPIADDVATAVNRVVYEHVAAGSHPAAALREAIAGPNGLRSRADTSHADDWAAFTHYGCPLAPPGGNVR